MARTPAYGSQIIRLGLLAALAATPSATRATAEDAVPEFRSTSRFVLSDPALPTVRLAPRTPVSGSIDGADVRRFALDLKAGDFAAIRLDQLGGDLILVLFDPDGKLVNVIDQNNVDESEIGLITATKAGRYHAQVAQYDWKSGTHDFAIEVVRREPVGRTPRARADQMFNSWYHADHAGAAMVVLRDGKAVYRAAAGLADIEQRIPITARTRFELASVSKQFTGAAIAMLIEQGQLARSDDVRKYLPEVPDFGTPITIGHLLDHSSGLRDWDASFGLVGLSLRDGISRAQVLDFVANQRSLNFAPGSAQQYSNTGYVLLGEIVTRVTGTPADAWMQRNLFAPLDMSDTRFNDDGHAVVATKAHSYEGRVPVTRLESGNSTGLGGSTSVLSTADDLVKWVNALDNGRVGGAAVAARLASFGALNDGTPLTYSFGNWHGVKRGLRVISHLGLGAGFRTMIARYPDQKISVIFLANNGDDAAYARAEQIEAQFLPFAPEPPVDAPIDTPPDPVAPEPPIVAADFAGTYYSDELRTAYDVRGDQGRLVAAHTLNGRIDLTRAGGDNFTSTRWFMPQLHFIRDASGRIIAFETSTDGARGNRFRRIDGAARP